MLSIPSVGDRARAVLGLTTAGAETHTGRSMRNVLETLPRDLVFELDAHALVAGIEQLAAGEVGLVFRAQRGGLHLHQHPGIAGLWVNYVDKSNLALARDRGLLQIRRS